MSHIVHHVTGRLRVRSLVVHRNPRKARQAERFISDIRGVDSARVSQLTGSIIISYDPELVSPQSLMSALNAEGFRLATLGQKALPSPHPWRSSQTQFSRKLGPSSGWQNPVHGGEFTSVPVLGPHTAQRLAETLAKTVLEKLVEKAIERSVVGLISVLL